MRKAQVVAVAFSRQSAGEIVEELCTGGGAVMMSRCAREDG